MISLDETAPGFEVPGAEYCFLDIAREPVLILERNIRNMAFCNYRKGKKGIASLQEHRHKTADYSCCELSMQNNLEARAFTQVCYPRKFMMANLVAETYADNLEYLNQANMRYLNPSLIFFGKLRAINTSIPKLARRQSLAKLEREAPHPYLPWGAEVDFQQRPDVLRALLLQVYRKDTSCFYKSLPISDKHNESNLEDWPRFFSKEEQQQMTETGWQGGRTMSAWTAFWRTWCMWHRGGDRHCAAGAAVLW